MQTHTRRPDKAAGLALASMAAGLTGATPGCQVVAGSAPPCVSVCLSLSLSLSRPKRARGDPTATGAARSPRFIIDCRAPDHHRRHSPPPTPPGVRGDFISQLSSAPEACQGNRQGALLTALRFGCPLVELELAEQGAVLMVLLHTRMHAQSFYHFGKLTSYFFYF